MAVWYASTSPPKALLGAYVPQAKMAAEMMPPTNSVNTLRACQGSLPE